MWVMWPPFRELVVEIPGVRRLGQSSYLSIAQLDYDPPAVALLSHVHREEAALHPRRQRPEHLRRRRGAVVDHSFPVRAAPDRFAVENEHLPFDAERHAAPSIRSQGCQFDVFSKDQAL